MWYTIGDKYAQHLAGCEPMNRELSGITRFSKPASETAISVVGFHLLDRRERMIPSKEELERLEQYVQNMQNLWEVATDLAALNESLEDFRDIMKDLQRLKLPTANQMQAAEKHLENLQAIEELAEV